MLETLSRRGARGPVRLLLDSGGIGGIERHVQVLATGLRRAGIDARLTLLAEHGDNPWLGQLKSAGLNWDVAQGGAVGLWRMLGREKVSLLHTHGYKAGILGRLAARLSGTPVVSTFHAGERGAFPVWLYQMADEWSGILATRVSVSARIAGALPFRSVLAPNFIDAPERPPCQMLPAAIGFVGRLSREKGPDIFCELAQRSDTAASWHVFGDGPMRAELQAQHGSRVCFHGMTQDMGAVWPTLGLLVMCSRAEGLPMAALEAMAAGIPVAASRVGGLPELVEHGSNGWLLEPEDLIGWEDVVETWACQRLTSGAFWREAAWRTARDRYGMRAGVEATQRAYQAAGFSWDAAVQASR